MCWSAGHAAGAFDAPGTSTDSSLPGLNLAELEALAAPHLPPQAAKAYLRLRLLADQLSPLQASQRALARELQISQTTVWKSLRHLERSGLLERERPSRRRPSRLTLPYRHTRPAGPPAVASVTGRNHSESASAPADGPFVTVLAALGAVEPRAAARPGNHSDLDGGITRTPDGAGTYAHAPAESPPAENHSAPRGVITRSLFDTEGYDDSEPRAAARQASSDSPVESLGVRNESLPIPTHTCEEEKSSHVSPFPDRGDREGVRGAAEEALKGRAESAVEFRRAVDLLLAVPGWMSRTKTERRKEKTEGILRVYTRRWPVSTVELWIRISGSRELRTEVRNPAGWIRHHLDGYGRRNWHPRTAGGRAILWHEALLRGAYESAQVYLRRRAGYRVDVQVADERKRGQEAMSGLRAAMEQDPELRRLRAECAASWTNLEVSLDEVDLSGLRSRRPDVVAPRLPRDPPAAAGGPGGDLDGGASVRRGAGGSFAPAGGEGRRGAA